MKIYWGIYTYILSRKLCVLGSDYLEEKKLKISFDFIKDSLPHKFNHNFLWIKNFEKLF